MKNIEINTKAVKKVFAAGLLALTMTGCGGNSEPTKEETPQGETTEEKENETTYFSEKETRALKEGDILNCNTLPDRKVLEEMGLDYIVVCEQYVYITSDVNDEPKDLKVFEKKGEIELYLLEGEKMDAVDDMVGWMNENNEFEWSVNKPIEIQIVSFEYGKNEENEVVKEIVINDQIHVVEPVCEECVKTYQK